MAPNKPKQDAAGIRAKGLKKIRSFTLHETSSHQRRLRPDHVAMLVRSPGVHPFRRNSIEAIRPLRRAKRPRLRQSRKRYWLAPIISVLLGARFGVRVRRRQLARRTCGHGGSCAVGTGGGVVRDRYLPALPSKTAAHAPSPPNCSRPCCSYVTADAVRNHKALAHSQHPPGSAQSRPSCAIAGPEV